MSSLKAILDRFPSALQSRYTHHIEELASLGIYTVQEFQEVCIDDLAKQTKHSLYDLHQLWQDVSYYSSIASYNTAATLWESEQRQRPQLMLSTGHLSIDNAFQSKLAYSEVTEIYGLQMLEKYEICLNMLLSLKEKSKDVVVIAYYVDINHHFDAHQVEELYLTSPKYISHRNSGITSQDLLSQIHCVQCPNPKSVLLFLERTSTIMMAYPPSAENPIQLVFLDSWDQLDLPPELSKVVYYVSMTLHYLSLLRANDYTLLLMFHNASEQHDGLFYPANLGPYANLGPTWSFISDKQMMLPFYESSRQIELIKNRIR